MKILDHTAKELERIKEYTLKSFDNDVKPLFDHSQEFDQGNKVLHFGIVRQVMAYIEVCGAIYCGWEEKNNKDRFDTRRVATSDKAIRFIEEILGGSIDSYYKANGRLFYVMYRHGSTHLLRPHRIKSKKTGHLYSWRWYSGERKGPFDLGNGVAIDIRHLHLIRRANCYELPVSISCICKDSKKGIAILFDNLIRTRKRMKLPLKQRRALTFISDGIVVRDDV